jgi:hypothetical protein
MKKEASMKRILLAALAAAHVAAPAYAEATAPPPPDDAVVVLPHVHFAAADETAEAWKKWSEDFAREMRTSFGTMFGGRMTSGKVVKGAPYSAEIVTETNQPMADGNVISKKTAGLVYRDGQGRTRQESGAPGKDKSIFINDPVADRSIVLNPGSKRAIVNPRAHVFTKDIKSKQVVRIEATEVRVEDGKVFIDGREVADGNAVVKSKSGKEVKVEKGKVYVDGREVGKGDGSGTQVTVNRLDSEDGSRREEVRVQVVRSGDDRVIPVPPMPPVPPTSPGALTAPLAPLPPMPGISTLRFESTARLGKGITTNLGTKEFDGVRAEGKSTTWTIPAGEIGNRNPINIVSETWYSPDLQVTVHSRYADPRTGESIYRLAGIRRGEPPADLFNPPEGYDVKDRTRQRDEALENARKGREESLQRAREQRERAREQRDLERRKTG